MKSVRISHSPKSLEYSVIGIGIVLALNQGEGMGWTLHSTGSKKHETTPELTKLSNELSLLSQAQQKMRKCEQKKVLTFEL